jgi:CheY-like chemotaxis protein
MKAILFVDDQEVLARLSCDILHKHGYSAEYAYSGSDALEKFEQKTFDILVTDFQMPGMNGLQLARLVRRKIAGIPVIIVSGYPPVEGSGEVNDWLQKEELFPALLDKIKQYIGDSTEEELQSA